MSEFQCLRHGLRAVYAALERSPYDGPEPCVCGHDYGKHSGSDAAAPCLARGCTCEAFEAEA